MKMRKKVVSTLLSTVMVVSASATTFAAGISDFSDVNEKHWGYKALEFSVENDLLKGTKKGKLEPDASLTRAEMVTIINRAFESKTMADIKNFNDVPKKAWYYDEIAKAVQMGTIKGRSENQMDPDAAISRQEVITVLFRALALKDGDLKALDEFKDGDKVWDYAKPAVAALIRRGVLEGDNAKKINPEAPITRAEFAKLMQGEFPNIVRDEEGLKDIKEGNVLIGGKVRNIKDADIKGDLILVDGLGDEKITIDRSKVSQRILVRGGDLDIKGSEVKEGITVNNPNRTTKITGADIPELIQNTKVDFIGNAEKIVAIGDANVDQRQYPLVSPFIHPPFYNARVKVTLNKDGKVVSVVDNDTADLGWDPSKSKEFWEKKNGPYWNMVLASDLFSKFEGKTRDEIEKDVKVKTGEADVVTGATESSKAVKEAVLNAIDGKKGKTFLTSSQTLKTERVVTGENGYEIVFRNTLPKDFEVKLHSVANTIYNGESVVDAKKYDWTDNGDGTFTLVLKGKDFPVGKYFVNIVDKNGKYRSPDFESGHGTPVHHPFFEINRGDTIEFKDGKLVASDSNLANVSKNISEIVVKEKNNPQAREVEVEPVGHHGTKGTYEKDPMFKEDGTINPEMKNGRRQTPVFKPGVTYDITVETFGYGETTFEYTVPGTLEGDANVDQRQYPLVSPFIHPPFYNARVKVEVGADGRVVSVSDNETAKKGWDPSKSEAFWARKNGKFWDMIVKSKLFSKFKDKTKEEIEKDIKVNTGEADVVTGATESSKAVKEAVLNALEGKAGKLFLTAEETLKTREVKKTAEGYEIVFDNTLPVDFKVKFHSVANTIYNMESEVDKSKYQWIDNGNGSFTLKLKGDDFLAGKYFVNIVDASGKYRSPDFESGHGTPVHHPFFVIDKGAELKFEDGKLTSTDNDLANVNKNIEEIVIKEKNNPSAKEVEIEPVGHHGTKGSYEKDPLFKADGSINEGIKTGRTPVAVFAPEKTYEITVETFGYGELTFNYTASETAGDGVISPEDDYKTGESPVGSFGYDAKVKIYMKDENTIDRVEDNGTEPGGSKGFWTTYLNGKGFDKYAGKNKAEVNAMKVGTGGADVVTGATESSKAVREAVLKALN